MHEVYSSLRHPVITLGYRSSSGSIGLIRVQHSIRIVLIPQTGPLELFGRD